LSGSKKIVASSVLALIILVSANKLVSFPYASAQVVMRPKLTVQVAERVDLDPYNLMEPDTLSLRGQIFVTNAKGYTRLQLIIIISLPLDENGNQFQGNFSSGFFKRSVAIDELGVGAVNFSMPRSPSMHPGVFKANIITIAHCLGFEAEEPYEIPEDSKLLSLVVRQRIFGMIFLALGVVLGFAIGLLRNKKSTKRQISISLLVTIIGFGGLASLFFEGHPDFGKDPLIDYLLALAFGFGGESASSKLSELSKH